MTFTIPEFALNVTLQEDRYLQCVDGLKDMLERYYKVSSPCISLRIVCDSLDTAVSFEALPAATCNL